jgi:FixJ family two-component response regulator
MFMIAVVDDDQRILESLESLLESAGYAVRLFPSAAAFLSSDVLEQTDCLISDIDLPAMDGFQLSRIVTKARPTLPIILMTGHPEILNDPQSARASAEFRLFKKPFDSQELISAIREALAR